MADEEQGESDAQRAKPETAASILETFAENTTGHGIPQIILNPYIAAKLFWSVMVTIAVVVFCVQTLDILSNYYTFRTNIKLISSEQVEFPAVTICNFNRMRRSKLGKSDRFKIILEKENVNFLKDVIGDTANYDWLWDSFLDSFYDHFVEDAKTENPEKMNETRQRRETMDYETNTEKYSYYSDGLDWLSFNELFQNLDDDFVNKILDKMAPTKDELRKMGHQAKDFILQCSFNERKCNYTNFATFQNKQYGNCFTLNLTSLNEERGRITKVGSEYGLHLTLFIEQLEYIGFFTEESGVRLAIHGQNILPHLEDVGLSIAPGFATSIGLRQVELKRLGWRFGNCTDGEEKNHLDSDRYEYTVTSCQKKCLLDKMKMECGCVSNIYDEYADVPNCQGINATDGMARCQQKVEGYFHTNKIHCNCPAPCHEYFYKTQLSSALWPSATYQPHLREKLKAANITAYRTLDKTETSRKNLVRVKVYFEELNYELIEQVPAYTVASVLGTIGGLLGLYIGFSVLTTFEVVILLYHLTKLAVRKAIPRINTGIDSRGTRDVPLCSSVK